MDFKYLIYEKKDNTENNADKVLGGIMKALRRLFRVMPR
jgi:hypothetical protein